MFLRIYSESQNRLFTIKSKLLTLRSPNDQGVHAPVVPDLAQTVKVGSDHYEKLIKVLGDAKNGINATFVKSVRFKKGGYFFTLFT